METFLLFIDKYLVYLFKITGNPVTDFFLGIFLLCFLTVVVGEFTISIAFRLNQKHIDTLNEDLIEKNNVAISAAKQGDKKAWKALNRRANDAFGKSFFAQIGLGLASLWPIFFSLAFLQQRFGILEFPLPFGGLGFRGGTVNYVFLFLLNYILARILFKQFKYKLPYFKQMKPLLDKYEKQTEKMVSFD